jgi:hypothetical protein
LAGDAEIHGENLPRCHLSPEIPFDVIWNGNLAAAARSRHGTARHGTARQIDWIVLVETTLFT